MGEIVFESAPYPKQIEFFKATAPRIAYGGARGGGKSWAGRTKAVLLACNYPGIQILLLRRTFPELRENHVKPLQRLLKDAANYNKQEKTFSFPSGAAIVLGYCANDDDVLQYQGQAYDVIIMEEATQFSEYQYQALTECNRTSTLIQVEFSPRMYFTANPGGVGHEWFKRLFITRQYRAQERAEDYVFIPANVYDNTFLTAHSPDYVRNLENLPEARKRAMLYGDWDVFEGQYFAEWDSRKHVVDEKTIPAHWKRYRCMDYGMDMLAVYWVAVDEDGNGVVYRELYEGRDNEKGPGGNGLTIAQAAKRITECSDAEPVLMTLAPPDLWNRRQETGRSVADIFREHGIVLTQASNDRVDGWMAMHDWLGMTVTAEGVQRPKLQVYRCCTNLIRCIPALQHDDKRVEDVKNEPHELTHGPDALRMFCVYWVTAARVPKKKGIAWTKDMRDDYRRAPASVRAEMERKWGKP